MRNSTFWYDDIFKMDKESWEKKMKEVEEEKIIM